MFRHCGLACPQRIRWAVHEVGQHLQRRCLCCRCYRLPLPQGADVPDKVKQELKTVCEACLSQEMQARPVISCVNFVLSTGQAGAMAQFACARNSPGERLRVLQCVLALFWHTNLTEHLRACSSRGSARACWRACGSSL